MQQYEKSNPMNIFWDKTATWMKMMYESHMVDLSVPPVVEPTFEYANGKYAYGVTIHATGRYANDDGSNLLNFPTPLIVSTDPQRSLADQLIRKFLNSNSEYIRAVNYILSDVGVKNFILKDFSGNEKKMIVYKPNYLDI